MYMNKFLCLLPFLTPKNDLLKHLRFKSTIFSLSSGHGKCGVAVFRVSGPNAIEVITKMTKLRKSAENLRKRQMFVTNIIDPDSKTFIDQGIVLWFPG